MNRFVALTLVIVAGSCSGTVPTDYKGYKVYRLTPDTQQQLDVLERIHDDFVKRKMTDDVEFWTEKAQNRKPVLVMVSPSQEAAFLQTVDREGIKHDVTIPDLAVAIQEESKMGPEDRKAIANGDMTWTAYHRYSTIEAFITKLARDNPELVKMETIGQSYEGRNLYLLTIGKAKPAGQTKPAIWMDAQIHAREWIASATVTYMIDKLIKNYKEGDATAVRMLDELDWFVLPVLNVDGFEYTKTGNRMNRLTRSQNPFSARPGADPNRNYDFKWMQSVGGVSQIPADEQYAGAYPFSEVENLYLTEEVLKRRADIKVLLTFHSYAQMWLYGWGFDATLPADWRDMHAMGVAATNAIYAKFNTRYEVGSATHLLNAAAGATDDWGKAKGMIKYSFTVELRDTGRFGFILPPEQIIPSGEETYEALVVVADIALRENPPAPAP